MLACLLVLTLARLRGRLRRQAGGEHAHRIALRVMDTPALPLLLRRVALAQPRDEVKRHPSGGLHGKRGGRDPQDHLGALADRRGDAGSGTHSHCPPPRYRPAAA